MDGPDVAALNALAVAEHIAERPHRKAVALISGLHVPVETGAGGFFDADAVGIHIPERPCGVDVALFGCPFVAFQRLLVRLFDAVAVAVKIAECPPDDRIVFQCSHFIAGKHFLDVLFNAAFAVKRRPGGKRIAGSVCGEIVPVDGLDEGLFDAETLTVRVSHCPAGIPAAVLQGGFFVPETRPAVRLCDALPGEVHITQFELTIDVTLLGPLQQFIKFVFFCIGKKIHAAPPSHIGQQ